MRVRPEPWAEIVGLWQRALAAGSSALGSTRSIDAGNFNAGEDASEWKRLIGGTDGLSTEATAHAGVYAAGERMLAVNRPLAEDDTRIVPEATVAELFRGLDFTRVDDRPGNGHQGNRRREREEKAEFEGAVHAVLGALVITRPQLS